MKTKLLSIAAAAAFVAVGFVSHSAFSTAEAQNSDKAPVILVVNIDQVVAQSKAGKTIPAQAESVRESVAKELEAEAEKLKKDIENFQKNAELMSDEVKAKTAQDLELRRQYGLPQRAQIMEQAFRATLQNARAKVLTESQPILKEIVDKRGATVLLDRSAVMYAASETDVTQEVISRLDKKLKKVEVQKVSLAEVEKQLKEAQAKQAQGGN